VTFELENGSQIQVRAEKDSIRVMGVGFGMLTIKPHSGNVVTIKYGE
jgi:hypothetical protein